MQYLKSNFLEEKKLNLYRLW